MVTSICLTGEVRCESVRGLIKQVSGEDYVMQNEEEHTEQRP